jgi:PGF-pre-PGF domain-containing protein
MVNEIMSNKKNYNKLLLTSTSITLLIIVILLIYGSDTSIPISNISLTINNGSNPINARFDPINGPGILDDLDISIDNVTISPNSEYSGYGNRLDKDTIGSEQRFYFADGVGFGYDSGGSSGGTRSSSSGSYSSGGGGGGGGTSGENFSNIITQEKYDLHIFKDKTTRYRFKNTTNPIIYVNITGNINAGEITTSVELLKNTSILVNRPVDQLVYKNINIWVGTSGFAVPSNIKSAAIGFRVENTWITANGLSGNNVKMFKWNGKNWVELVTAFISNDDTYSYYRAETNAFSPFAIGGVKETASLPAETISSGQTASVTIPLIPLETIQVNGSASSTGQKPIFLSYILIVIGIIAAAAFLYIRKRKK